MSFNEEENREEKIKAGEFGDAIQDFRAALNHLAEREAATPIVTANWLGPARRRQRLHHQRLALAWACAAVLCAATTLPFMIHSPAPAAHSAIQEMPTTTTSAAVEAPQTGLLEQVDEDVSESVPSSLAPLTEMDNWNSTNVSNDESTQPMENANAAH